MLLLSLFFFFLSLLPSLRHSLFYHSFLSFRSFSFLFLTFFPLFMTLFHPHFLCIFLLLDFANLFCGSCCFLYIVGRYVTCS
uniref:Uncharacterized protein n=1 Tax=Rhipicephalus pulchellus TaxID=72859 RepID=L7LZ15_RHIPC